MDNVLRMAASNALAFVDKMVKHYGQRVSGTIGNADAIDAISAELKRDCDSVTVENFDIYPDSLFAIGKVFSVAYIIGVCGVFIKLLPGIYISILIMSICIVYCVSQFFLYSDLFDRLFKKTVGRNVIGLIEPKGNVQKQILLVGHHDSSYIYPFHEKYTLLFPFRLFLPMLLFVIEYCFLILKTASGFIQLWQQYLCIAGLVFVLPMFGYISRKGSLGAGDNLIGCAIAIEVAKNLRYKLDQTRLIVLLTDGEEVGQKGARSFIKSNIQMLKNTETQVINVDSIYKKEDIALLKRDRNGLTALSSTMNTELLKIANNKGYKIKHKKIPLGGGGTDAAQFALKGMQTVSIVGIPMNAFRKEIIIHTSKDIPESIEEEATGIMIDIIQEYIKTND